MVQVLSEALQNAGLLRTQSRSSRNPTQHTLASLAAIREEIRIVMEETAIIQDQVDTLSKEVEVRRLEIERANESIIRLQQENNVAPKELTPEEQELEIRRVKTARFEIAFS